MSSYPQAPCRSSLDSTIAVKMLKPEGWQIAEHFFYFVFFKQETYPSQQGDCSQELLNAYERHRTFKTR